MADRIPLDYYPTPAWCVHSLARRWPVLRSLRVCDPCAGNGDLLRALWPWRWFAIEIDDSHRDSLEDLSSKSFPSWVKTQDDLSPATAWAGQDPIQAVVMNPPYKLATEFVRRALVEAPIVAALLRLTWLEPSKARADLLGAPGPLRPWVGVLAKRPRFRSDRNGSDSSASAWFLWGLGAGFEMLPKEEGDGRPR